MAARRRGLPQGPPGSGADPLFADRRPVTRAATDGLDYYDCCVVTIPHREHRNDSSRVLRAVQAGATFEVTNHGEVVAILSPADAAGSNMRFRPATARGGFAALSRV